MTHDAYPYWAIPKPFRDSLYFCRLATCPWLQANLLTARWVRTIYVALYLTAIPNCTSAALLLSNITAHQPSGSVVEWVSTGGEDVGANTPVGYRYYGLFLVREHTPGYWLYSYYSPGNYIVNIPAGATWKTAQEQYSLVNGSSGSVVGGWGPERGPFRVCFGAARSQPGIDPHPLSELMLQNGDSCLTGPLSDVSCSASDISIDHGTLSPSAVPGDRQSRVFEVVCSAPATVKPRIPQPAIELGSGVTSNVWIDEVPVGGTVDIVGSINLTMVSQLNGAGASPGVHSGSTVVILEVL